MGRKSARLREVDDQQAMSLLPHGQNVRTPFVPVSGTPLEHDHSMISPIPTIRLGRCPLSTVGNVPKILLEITNEDTRKEDYLTPEKKLLYSIDKVGKAVMEELQRLKTGRPPLP